jgi:hypothetical protein
VLLAEIYRKNLDDSEGSPRLNVTMPEKRFEAMTLDEVFDLEARYSANAGRSVVSKQGTLELLADPKFKAHLERMKNGKVRYRDAAAIRVHPCNPR